MGKSQAGVTALAASAAVCGTYHAARLFVPAPGTGAATGTSSALRGAEAAPPAIAAQSAGGERVIGATSLVGGGVVAAAAAGLASTRRASRRAHLPKAARGAEAAAAATPAAEEEPPKPFQPSEQLGAQLPLGFFDPAGFAKVGDEEGFINLRIAELKHGRVAMMAAVGAVIQHYLQFPGFDSVPKGLGAVLTPPGTYGFVLLVLVSGALELTIWKDDVSKGAYQVGNYGNPLQLGMGSEPWGLSDDMKNREIENGRAAMFAILGIVSAELLTGKDGMEQLGFS